LTQIWEQLLWMRIKLVLKGQRTIRLKIPLRNFNIYSYYCNKRKIFNCRPIDLCPRWVNSQPLLRYIEAWQGYAINSEKKALTSSLYLRWVSSENQTLCCISMQDICVADNIYLSGICLYSHKKRSLGFRKPMILALNPDKTNLQHYLSNELSTDRMTSKRIRNRRLTHIHPYCTLICQYYKNMSSGIIGIRVSLQGVRTQ